MSYARGVTVVGCVFFFFNDTATTEIYTLSLHDALPISIMIVPYIAAVSREVLLAVPSSQREAALDGTARDRKSTRLNSSHSQISDAVFCLKKKNASSTPAELTSNVKPDVRSLALKMIAS